MADPVTVDRKENTTPAPKRDVDTYKPPKGPEKKAAKPLNLGELRKELQ